MSLSNVLGDIWIRTVVDHRLAATHDIGVQITHREVVIHGSAWSHMQRRDRRRPSTAVTRSFRHAEGIVGQRANSPGSGIGQQVDWVMETLYRQQALSEIPEIAFNGVAVVRMRYQVFHPW